MTAEAWASVWWWASAVGVAVNIGLAVRQVRMLHTWGRLNDLWLEMLVAAWRHRHHVEFMGEIEAIRRRHVRRMLGLD